MTAILVGDILVMYRSKDHKIPWLQILLVILFVIVMAMLIKWGTEHYFLEYNEEFYQSLPISPPTLCEANLFL